MLSSLSVNSFAVFFVTSVVHEAYCALRLTSFTSFVSGFVFLHRPALRVSVPAGLCTCTPIHSGERRLHSVTGLLIFACVPESTADS
jgi:hypothetical protein